MILPLRGELKNEVVMRIGLIDVDGKNFPNIALMKLSAYHKDRGDEVYYKRFCEIYKLRIIGVKIIEKPPISSIEYYIVEEDDNISMCLAEQLLFPTKEELLKSL